MIANKLSSQPQEWFFEVVVGFGRDVVILQILLAVEGNGLCFDFALFDINLVAAKNDGNVFADSDEVAFINSVSRAHG